MKKLFLFILAGLSLTIYSCGQKAAISQEEKSADVRCDSIVSIFAKEEFAAFSKMLKSSSFLEKSAIDTLQQNLISQMQIAKDTYGDLIGYEFVAEKKVNDLIKRRLYVLKFRKYFMKFQMILYKPKDQWMITDVNCDSDVLELLY